jgi:hypothetical protein
MQTDAEVTSKHQPNLGLNESQFKQRLDVTFATDRLNEARTAAVSLPALFTFTTCGTSGFPQFAADRLDHFDNVRKLRVPSIRGCVPMALTDAGTETDCSNEQ